METRKTPKKRIVIFFIIIIALLAVGVIVNFFLIPEIIAGDWELIVNPDVSKATPDETQERDRVYYSFSEPDKNGEGNYKTYFDGGVEEGTYALSEKGDRRYVNMGTEDLEYTITGTMLFGGAKLTITYPESTDEQTGQTTPAQDYVFTQAKALDYEKGTFNSYQTNESLLGEWATNERTLSYYVYELSYKETVEFKDNGIMTIHYESADLALDRVLYYAYTTEDDALTFSLVTDKDTEYTVLYSFDDNGNLRFINDDTSASIFADSFFSDVTYYPSDKLPESKRDETSQ